jgi:hypothetical protein
MIKIMELEPEPLELLEPSEPSNQNIPPELDPYLNDGSCATLFQQTIKIKISNLELETYSPEQLELTKQPELHQNIHPESELHQIMLSHKTVTAYNQMYHVHKTKVLYMST